MTHLIPEYCFNINALILNNKESRYKTSSQEKWETKKRHIASPRPPTTAPLEKALEIGNKNIHPPIAALKM